MARLSARRRATKARQVVTVQTVADNLSCSRKPDMSDTPATTANLWDVVDHKRGGAVRFHDPIGNVFKARRIRVIRQFKRWGRD